MQKWPDKVDYNFNMIIVVLFIHCESGIESIFVERMNDMKICKKYKSYKRIIF
jgi:hypothetical protein